MEKLKTIDIEIAVARFFNPRINIIVPNICWGLGLKYECDLLIISPYYYATEIEIKVSKNDIKQDLKKSKYSHRASFIRRFLYAVPNYLENCEFLPKDCGIVTVDKDLGCKIIKSPRINKDARKLKEHEINKLLHLGCMRIWTLKEHAYRRKQGFI